MQERQINALYENLCLLYFRVHPQMAKQQTMENQQNPQPSRGSSCLQGQLLQKIYRRGNKWRTSV